MIRIDGQAYQWLGDSLLVNFSTTVANTITPTRTIFTIQAGSMTFNVTFFSPIEVYRFLLRILMCRDLIISKA
jgi:hypothetical protein